MAKAKAARAPDHRAKAPSPTEDAVSPEESARRTLAWGAGALILGLAAVGIGFDQAGMVPVLAGLLLLVYGIHSYGRLGPEDVFPDPGLDEAGIAAARSAAWRQCWMGGLIAAAGLAVTLGTAAAGGTVIIAYGAVLGGGFRLFRGLSALSRLQKVPTVVEKRRRLNKSAPP